MEKIKMTNAVSNLIASRINHQQEKQKKIHKNLPAIRFQTNQLLLQSLINIPTPPSQDPEVTNQKKLIPPVLMNHLQPNLNHQKINRTIFKHK